ncbi:bacteriophage T4 gp5 trimerisation domain-containing protein, partial [Campylobacter jejuni]|uniref:bacteriophage T4 gp5 trimerisation domain-containing protein n=1 Tax=Campylobacter jejuni TaxID=197 RepID=UPI003D315901
SLYNGANPSLVNLPFNDHQTSLSSKTIGVNEEGYNELTLSNIKDKEQIYLKAQKDYDELVQHNFTQRILNDKDSIVDGIYNERIKKVHTQTIDLAKNVNVGGEYLTNVGLSTPTFKVLLNPTMVSLDKPTLVKY